ncbi:MAG: type II secretion system F family protein [Candidatus Omnitrophica bacterium]|nr:type II secretion system F family protein [Candidatus Omnitrophota bacterium]
MTKYLYKAINKNGQSVSDTIMADSEHMVADKLKNTGLKIIFIKKAKEENSGLSSLMERFNRVKSSELNLMTRQLAVMQRAGVNIITSLASLSDQTNNTKLKEVLLAISSDIKAGKSLSDAFERFPNVFGPLYTNLIRAGEESGTLPDVFERLAELGDYEEKVQRRIKAATRYPVIVVCVIVVAFIFLTVLIVPRFSGLYNSAGVSLPLPTLILLGINDAITKFWWVMMIFSGGIGVLARKYLLTKQGRYFFDSLQLKVPIIGPLMIKIIMGRFAKICGIMIRAGVSILRILDFTSAGVGNVVIAQAIERIKNEVKAGNRMSVAMKQTGLFPPVVIQMVTVGEDTGKLDELFLYVSDYYEGEAGFIIENMTSLIEPFLILILGGGVLLLALGIFLPMWNMMTLFKR